MKGRYLNIRRAQQFILAHRSGLLATVALVCVFDWVVSTQKPRSIPASNFGSSTSAAIDPSLVPKDARFSPFYSGRSGRVIYPYSVIPGGVRSVQELKNAIAGDSVVSAHYAQFHLQSARIVHLDRARLMHVSYRLGNQVYWTKRVMKLAKGETVITDGVRIARTRCGNMLAEMIPSPGSPLEPPPGELDTPVSLDFNYPFHPEYVSAQGPGGTSTETGPTSKGAPPVVIPSPGPTIPILYVPLPGPPPVVKVSEPGTAMLLLAALPILWLLRKRKHFWGSK